MLILTAKSGTILCTHINIYIETKKMYETMQFWLKKLFNNKSFHSPVWRGRNTRNLGDSKFTFNLILGTFDNLKLKQVKYGML